VNLAPPDDRYPEVLQTAIRGFWSGGRASGAAALEPIAGELWRLRVARARLVGEPAAGVAKAAAGSRRFTPARAGATFRRDHFHCRYCGGRVIPVALMSLLSHLYPDELPYVPTYKDVHPMYWTRGAEADHIEPGSKGGDWEVPGNHATACVRCNTAKSDHRLEEIGWKIEEAPASDWDGLTSWYRPLWERTGEPNPRYHLGWIRALADEH
jgi:5-methylcytosine-specific restriction endonuclease McrA